MLILILAAGLALIACAIGFQQIRHYRESVALTAGTDLFIFTRWRLIIRLTGSAVLVAIAVMLAIWELGAPLSPAAAGQLVTALLVEVALLVVVAILDLRETARRKR